MTSDEDKENDGVAYRIGVLPTSKRARKPRTQDKDADDFSAKMTDISLVCQAKAAHDNWVKRREKGNEKFARNWPNVGMAMSANPEQVFTY